jgi:hydroxymethylpyrimidine/phosphomethylpyrimidine kinase
MFKKKPPPPPAAPAASKPKRPSGAAAGDTSRAVDQSDPDGEDTAPACVMLFNASDASGAGGVAGDVSTVVAMGAHPLPVVTSIVLRDTAEVFEQHVLDEDVLANQARSILEDVTVAGWKVGFLGSAESVSVVAEILADYPDVPLVSYLPNLAWMNDDEATAYHDAFRELILPATEVLVGNHKNLTDFLLPEWDNERPPSARELAVAAAEHGTRFVLVTGVMLPNKAPASSSKTTAGTASAAVQWVDNILASSEGALAGEKFERFEANFVGAGETLAAALAALLASGAELQTAVGEALQFLDQSLDAGFRPGMGNVVPDRFFWALPPGEDDDGNPQGGDEPGGPGGEPEVPPPRRMH